jgi:hypothetical protein
VFWRYRSLTTGNPILTGFGVGISSLLGAMGLALVRMNHRFLLNGVDRDITDDIEKILLEVVEVSIVLDRSESNGR